MPARLTNPAMLLPGAMEAIQSLNAVVQNGGVPPATLGLVHLRASQINGCQVCQVSGTSHLKQTGESDDRLREVANWRQATCFTPAECAALALAESVTRLADQDDPVPDDVWDEAARHYDERQLAALVLWIAMSNVFNRINVTTRQEARTWA